MVAWVVLIIIVIIALLMLVGVIGINIGIVIAERRAWSSGPTSPSSNTIIADRRRRYRAPYSARKPDVENQIGRDQTQPLTASQQPIRAKTIPRPAPLRSMSAGIPRPDSGNHEQRMWGGMPPPQFGCGPNSFDWDYGYRSDDGSDDNDDLSVY